MKLPDTEEIESALRLLIDRRTMGTHPAALAQQIYEEALRSPLLTAFTRHHNGVAEALLADGVLLGLKIAELREATA